ncbi:YbhB/YbcL family Raf kinase inhibitor-like protein [bacterium]|nr:MAG: YbhB/YbcL family Raf kinase inhibitor-like protein [bacterium]
MRLSPAKTLRITTAAFASHGAIPRRHAQEGENLSPELSWSGLPESTKQLALIVYDPDAPGTDPFVHWVAYGISPDATGLAEGETAPVEGLNSADAIGYAGPKPPPGHGPHHYFFWLFALDTALDLPSGLSREELGKAIDGHIIEQERLIGTFETPKG